MFLFKKNTRTYLMFCSSLLYIIFHSLFWKHSVILFVLDHWEWCPVCVGLSYSTSSHLFPWFITFSQSLESSSFRTSMRGALEFPSTYLRPPISYHYFLLKNMSPISTIFLWVHFNERSITLLLILNICP